MFLRIDGIEVKTRHSNGPGWSGRIYVTTEKLKGGRSGSHTE
jgi:hypothetical protein